MPCLGAIAVEYNKLFFKNNGKCRSVEGISANSACVSQNVQETVGCHLVGSNIAKGFTRGHILV